MEKDIVEKPSVIQQIKTALDGRTSRWLSLKASIPETALSNKMNGRVDFTDEELASIGQVFGIEIKRNK